MYMIDAWTQEQKAIAEAMNGQSSASASAPAAANYYKPAKSFKSVLGGLI